MLLESVLLESVKSRNPTGGCSKAEAARLRGVEAGRQVIPGKVKAAQPGRGELRFPEKGGRRGPQRMARQTRPGVLSGVHCTAAGMDRKAGGFGRTLDAPGKWRTVSTAPLFGVAHTLMHQQAGSGPRKGEADRQLRPRAYRLYRVPIRWRRHDDPETGRRVTEGPVRLASGIH